MIINPDEYLHIYNQGNNRQRIFFDDGNYEFFLKKVKKFIVPTVDILAYCLMPNHFHFLVHTTKLSGQLIRVGPINIPTVANGFRCLQSSYAQAINKRYNRSGSLFRQKTKFKLLGEEAYIVNCFHYIHQNPVKAGLVVDMNDWPYSSCNDVHRDIAARLCSQLPSEIFRMVESYPTNLAEIDVAALFD